MDPETTKYLSTIAKIPEDMLHLHDMIFPEGIVVENNELQLPFDYESDSFNKQKPLPYEKDIIDIYSSKKYWWNDIDQEYKKQLLWDAEERANNFLESTDMPEINDEEFEQILRELEKPPVTENIEEYCNIISDRLMTNPPIPLDMLLLHDAVFMDGESVVGRGDIFYDGSDIDKPKSDEIDLWSDL